MPDPIPLRQSYPHSGQGVNRNYHIILKEKLLRCSNGMANLYDYLIDPRAPDGIMRARRPRRQEAANRGRGGTGYGNGTASGL